MQLIGLCRLGADMELRSLPNGNPVGQLRLAYSWGQKQGPENRRPTQWIEAALFGERAKLLAPTLTKGRLLLVHLDDVRIETYTSKNGPGASLKARVQSVEFADSRGEGVEMPGKAQAEAAKPADLEDDIPF